MKKKKKKNTYVYLWILCFTLSLLESECLCPPRIHSWHRTSQFYGIRSKNLWEEMRWGHEDKEEAHKEDIATLIKVRKASLFITT